MEIEDLGNILKHAIPIKPSPVNDTIDNIPEMFNPIEYTNSAMVEEFLKSLLKTQTLAKHLEIDFKYSLNNGLTLIS